MRRNSKWVLTVSPKLVERRGGIVVLPLKEYQKLLASAVPTYYLKGKTAMKLDRLIEKGLQEDREGRTRTIRSLADIDA